MSRVPNSTSVSLEIDEDNVGGWSEPDGEERTELPDDPFEHLRGDD